MRKTEENKKEFRVALLQMLAGKTMDANLEKGLAFCRRAKAMGADLALFPKMWSIDYDLPATAAGRTA